MEKEQKVVKKSVAITDKPKEVVKKTAAIADKPKEVVKKPTATMDKSKEVVKKSATTVKSKSADLKPVKSFEKKKILFAASECMPFIATGGLGEVVGSLPKALTKISDFDIRVILPLHSDIPEDIRQRMTFLGSINTPLAWRKQYCGLFLIEENNVKFYFLDNEYYFKRNGIYGHFDDGERYAFFSKSILEVLSLINFYPDIIHCNDWQTALVPVYLKAIYSSWFAYENIKTIFTIHNIEYQGKYSLDIIEDVFGLSKMAAHLLEYDNMINLVKGAIQCADIVSTVSPTYAQEILSPYFSHGLHYILENNKGKIRGILNGIDIDSYNPATDDALFENFSAEDYKNKAKNKLELQKMLNLPEESDIPLLCIISRLVPHKGIDLVKCVIEELLQQKIQIIILGKGEAIYENYFTDIQKIFSDKVRAIISYNNDLSRKIYAGADIFLMPSKSEPCGLSQMIASRYGTVPIVRETGGLYDSIKDNGFTFTNYNAHEMLGKILSALELYDNKPEWDKLVKKVLKTDFSWNRSAREYVKMYQSLFK